MIEGTISKHRGRRPDVVEWGVPEIAARAAGVMLKLLAPWRSKTKSDGLFVTQTGKRIDDRLVNADLKEFLDRIGAPYVGGRPFPISSHMLRVALTQWLGAEIGRAHV